jgi:hypothetical protein
MKGSDSSNTGILHCRKKVANNNFHIFRLNKNWNKFVP